MLSFAAGDLLKPAIDLYIKRGELRYFTGGRFRFDEAPESGKKFISMMNNSGMVVVPEFYLHYWNLLRQNLTSDPVTTVSCPVQSKCFKDQYIIAITLH